MQKEVQGDICAHCPHAITPRIMAVTDLRGRRKDNKIKRANSSGFFESHEFNIHSQNTTKILHRNIKLIK